ncbi:MAG: helix-turn-helix transcriptional regulator [Candidatus Eremiobacteraeota bacterium]|nr:helix-turn-helix transcriptional regulator [Candidatus Eremiobacteraeota bacterium]MCW5872312.1 helix-turn-helix transcriptional regulator [Candidatus Eremiobacteraeota bacterium]
MNIFQTIKNRLHLSSQKMADRIGISRFAWRRLETGKNLPSPQQAQNLETLCGHALPTTAHLISSERMRLFETGRYQLPPVTPGPWLRLKSRVLPTTPGWRTLDWAQQLISCESDFEAKGWWSFIRAGAKPVMANPHELGFDLHPIVRADDRALGARVLPGFGNFEGNLPYLIFPQVRLRTPTIPARLDGLVWYKAGAFTGWADLEFDGAGHNFANDSRRTQALGLPAIRITQQVLESNQVLQTFLEHCRQFAQG